MPAEVAPPTAAQKFYERARSDLLRAKEVTEKRMFGTTALCVGGKVFLFPWKESVVFKLPTARAEALVDAKRATYFDPGHGRTSKAWISVSPSAKRE